ncbi:hypothetical protein [Polaromonas sp. YR568]|uniref:hypothetical protein n=1 Tax=Polaromonas sp. YR568 TaxID=1855301 RepID=UPI00398BDA1A
MKPPTHRAWLAVAAGLWTGAAMAGSAPAFLNVSITLRSANSVVPGVTSGLRAPIPRPLACTSETLTEPTNAVVRVVCATSQFVSIAPSPGKPFLGTHDSPFRYNLGTGAAGNATTTTTTGASTVTGLRIYNAYGSAGPQEMLVRF